MNNGKGKGRAFRKISLITILAGFTIIGYSVFVLHHLGYTDPQIAQEVHQRLNPAPASTTLPVAKPAPEQTLAKNSPMAARYGDARDTIFDQVNLIRISQGLKPLVRDTLLDKAASAKVGAEVDFGFFSHYDPDGAYFPHWIRDTGFIDAYSGENLSKNYDPADAVKAWVASPTHFANIIKPEYTATGIAIDGVYIVQYFASNGYEE